MAAGLAVLATNICGVPHQVQHDVTGLLFEPGDIGQLSALLARLANEPSLSTRLGEAAKATAFARYHASNVGRATRQAYETVLS
jgi:glycosyltransferase involved in cell wall biosynthesis